MEYKQVSKQQGGDKARIMKFAEEYGYKYQPSNLSVVIKGDGKSIEVFHKQGLYRELGGTKEKYINPVSMLMIYFNKV